MTTTDLVLETTPCLLCGSDCFTLKHSGPDYFMHLSGHFSLVQCAACGLLFQNPRPSLQVVGRYYPDTYGSYASAETGLQARKGLAGTLIRYNQRKRCRMLDRVVPVVEGRSRRLLDVGCASGLFLEAMQQYGGWKVEGVELNEAAAHATSARLNVPVFAGPVERAHFEDNSFDAVTMWDVLEHLHDPVVQLRSLRRIIRPGGALFVRLPDADSYLRAFCGRYWVGYDLPRHMSVFSHATLRATLAQAGFAVIDSFPSGSYLSAVHSLHFAMDDTRVSRRLGVAVRRTLMHPAARALAWLPFALADRLGGGSQMEVLARAM